MSLTLVTSGIEKCIPKNIKISYFPKCFKWLSLRTPQGGFSLIKNNKEKTKRKQNKKQSCITMRVQLLRKSHFRKSYINPVVINQSRHVKNLKEILKLGDVTSSMNLFHFIPLLILTCFLK